MSTEILPLNSARVNTFTPVEHAHRAVSTAALHLHRLLAPLCLPPENSHVGSQELRAAGKKLAAATSAYKRLGRES